MLTVYFLLCFIIAITLINCSYLNNKTRGTLFSRNEVEVIKGLAAFFVIIAHIYINGEHTSTGGLDGNITKAVGGALSQLGGIGVMLFFFFSGYGIEEGYGNREVGKQYIINRLKKVYLVYLFIKLAILAVEALVGLVSIECIFKRLVDICCIEDWFVLVIVLEYVFYYLVTKLFPKNKLVLLFFLNVVMGCLFFYLRLAARWYNSMWLFVVGVAFSLFQKEIIELNGRWGFIVILCSFAIFVGLGAVFAINKGETWCEVFKPISGMALMLLLANFFRFFQLNSPILKWGGQKSLYLYIVHLSLINYFDGLERVEIAICFLVLTVIVVLLLGFILNGASKLCKLFGKCVLDLDKDGVRKGK